MDFEPAYLSLLRSGELERRVDLAREMLSHCEVCARACGVDRLSGELGTCNCGRHALVSSAFPHLGEEDPLRGSRGSGTIFFSWCNLQCVFCQNHDISHDGEGLPVDADGLGRAMLSLQARGCHNVNLVTPSHVVPQALAGILEAARQGLELPIVYNTGGYDSLETLRLLDGVVDVYMPDLKSLDEAHCRRWFDAPDYPDVARAALQEMHRQVGDLVLDDAGIALRGMLVRHLVMPGCLEDSAEVLRWLASELSPRTYVNVMGQYRPEHRALAHPELARRVTPDEVLQAIRLAEQAGLERLDHRFVRFLVL